MDDNDDFGRVRALLEHAIQNTDSPSVPSAPVQPPAAAAVDAAAVPAAGGGAAPALPAVALDGGGDPRPALPPDLNDFDVVVDEEQLEQALQILDHDEQALAAAEEAAKDAEANKVLAGLAALINQPDAQAATLAKSEQDAASLAPAGDSATPPSLGGAAAGTQTRTESTPAQKALPQVSQQAAAPSVSASPPAAVPQPAVPEGSSAQPGGQQHVNAKAKANAAAQQPAATAVPAAPVQPAYNRSARNSVGNSDERNQAEKERIREENRERKKRWRESNQERNKDNDLRCRVTKRANKMWPKPEDREMKAAWITNEFARRREKRTQKEKIKDTDGSGPGGRPQVAYAPNQMARPVYATPQPEHVVAVQIHRLIESNPAVRSQIMPLVHQYLAESGTPHINGNASAVPGSHYGQYGQVQGAPAAASGEPSSSQLNNIIAMLQQTIDEAKAKTASGEPSTAPVEPSNAPVEEPGNTFSGIGQNSFDEILKFLNRENSQESQSSSTVGSSPEPAHYAASNGAGASNVDAISTPSPRMSESHTGLNNENDAPDPLDDGIDFDELLGVLDESEKLDGAAEGEVSSAHAGTPDGKENALATASPEQQDTPMAEAAPPNDEPPVVIKEEETQGDSLDAVPEFNGMLEDEQDGSEADFDKMLEMLEKDEAAADGQAEPVASNAEGASPAQDQDTVMADQPPQLPAPVGLSQSAAVQPLAAPVPQPSLPQPAVAPNGVPHQTAFAVQPPPQPAPTPAGSSYAPANADGSAQYTTEYVTAILRVLFEMGCPVTLPPPSTSTPAPGGPKRAYSAGPGDDDGGASKRARTTESPTRATSAMQI